MKYYNVQNLIENDEQAREYYSSLPDYVKEQISQRSDSVNSYESLKDYAENLLRNE